MNFYSKIWIFYSKIRNFIAKFLKKNSSPEEGLEPSAFGLLGGLFCDLKSPTLYRLSYPGSASHESRSKPNPNRFFRRERERKINLEINQQQQRHLRARRFSQLFHFSPSTCAPNSLVQIFFEFLCFVPLISRKKFFVHKNSSSRSNLKLFRQTNQILRHQRAHFEVKFSLEIIIYLFICVHFCLPQISDMDRDIWIHKFLIFIHFCNWNMKIYFKALKSYLITFNSNKFSTFESTQKLTIYYTKHMFSWENVTFFRWLRI